MNDQPNETDTDQLLDQAQSGDSGALAKLLSQHRAQLKRCVEWRIDPQLSQRLDSSDVVQEAFVTVCQRISDYCQNRPLPFFLWLRQIALDRLTDLHRAHLVADKRSLRREESLWLEQSSVRALHQLSNKDTGPLSRLVRRELTEKAVQGLEQLSLSDRQLLIMRYLEELDTRQVALVLGQSEAVVKVRQLRALRRLRKLLKNVD